MNISNLLLFSFTNQCLEAVMEKCPVVILGKCPKHFQNVPHYFSDLYLVHTNNFAENLDQWVKTQNFNPRAKFLFFGDAPALEILSQYYISNVAFISWNQKVYTYYPYKYQSINNIHSNWSYLGHCQKVRNYFSNNVPKF